MLNTILEYATYGFWSFVATFLILLILTGAFMGLVKYALTFILVSFRGWPANGYTAFSRPAKEDVNQDN